MTFTTIRWVRAGRLAAVLPLPGRWLFRPHPRRLPKRPAKRPAKHLANHLVRQQVRLADKFRPAPGPLLPSLCHPVRLPAQPRLWRRLRPPPLRLRLRHRLRLLLLRPRLVPILVVPGLMRQASPAAKPRFRRKKR